MRSAEAFNRRTDAAPTNAMISQPPNVIYILTDDQRVEMLGAAGHPVLRTPHLDRLAEQGVRFTQALCTSPACTPSRTSHYLGQWERRHAVNFDSHTAVSPDAFADSFPMRLKAAGYFTGWVGKNHVPVGDGGYHSGLMEQAFDYWYANHGHTGFYPKRRFPDSAYYKARANTQVEVLQEGAMNFLDPDEPFLRSPPTPLPRRPTDRPFCLCLTFNLPHCSSTNEMEHGAEEDELYRTVYRDRLDEIPLPRTYKPAGDLMPPRLPRSVYNGRPIRSYDYARSPETMREHLVREYQTITGIDRCVGALRKKLDDMGLAENTIIVFSTDHGIHFGEHGLRGKCFLYEQDLRIPLIVYDPSRPPDARGQLRDEMVVTEDLAPTILELCGQSVPSVMQGRSLVPLLRGEKPPWREAVFAEQLMDIQNYPRSECVRTANWKYIRYFARHPNPADRKDGTTDNYLRFLHDSPEGRLAPVYEELFDLANDPDETANLADEPEHASRLNALRERLIETGRSLAPPWPPRVVGDEPGGNPIGEATGSAADR